MAQRRPLACKKYDANSAVFAKAHHGEVADIINSCCLLKVNAPTSHKYVCESVTQENQQHATCRQS